MNDSSKNLEYSDEQKCKFYKFHNKLMKDIGCYYLAYSYQLSKKNINLGFNSNPDWEKAYFGKGLIKNCHLYSTADKRFNILGQEKLIFPWETAKALTSLEKDIALYREEMDIGHNGISFATRNDDGIIEFIAFAPDLNTPNFLTLVNKNIRLIKEITSLFRVETRSILYQKINAEES